VDKSLLICYSRRMMIKITDTLFIEDDEILTKFIRSPGPGGQHVNKVESAVQIRFDAKNCPTIDDYIFLRLKKISGQRMTQDGTVILTSNGTRSQTRNRDIAVQRLIDMIQKATIVPKRRRATKPSKAAKQRRLDTKKQKGTTKKLRSNKIYD
jgi:ribosome-associated protein